MSGGFRVILVQPPFIQLNSPYPAPYYLKSFLETRFGKSPAVEVLDHSIGLFERIFSRSGLERIFEDAARINTRGIHRGRVRAAAPAPGSKAARGVYPGAINAAYMIERFLSERELWIGSIERLIAFLRGKDAEWGHFLALANGRAPSGPRADAYLAERDGNISPDEAKAFATALLSDLADFITCALDSGFSLIRYTPLMAASLNSGLQDFSRVRTGLNGYIMDSFYRPMLDEEWNRLKELPPDERASPRESEKPLLLGITIPFPGCLSGALVCAESAKKSFGPSVRVVAGGGYVNTELRFLQTPQLFDYFDYVSFDRAYASLVSIIERVDSGEKDGEPLYKTAYRFEGRIVIPPDLNDIPEASAAAPGSRAGPEGSPAELDDEAARTVFPDYSEVDFGRYLYPVDDVNPMHRLWSDGHWLKAYLAHGCYWHSCAFCDVSLDYIRRFIPVDPAALFTHLKTQAEKTGVRGIHLCDEAVPFSSLLEFALLNLEAGLPLSFWGNIRFERDFTPDAAAILAAGGLVGVSAGIEVATERGFKRLGKGINLESAVRALAAFKEAGILTHAYLIYGYWDEDEREIIDSAETLRQLFAQGLLDSAFWHKFILTCHSRVYAEKQRGLHPALNVKDPGALFARNDLAFEGEEKYEKYSEGLELLLRAWMAGETETPVTEAFPFKVKAPEPAPDLAARLIDSYARERDLERTYLPGTKDSAAGRAPLGAETSAAADTLHSAARIRGPAGAARENVLFLGSLPMPQQVPLPGQKGNGTSLFWRWRLCDRTLTAGGEAQAEKIAALLRSASRGRGMNSLKFYSVLEEIAGKAAAQKIWRSLRENGLAVY